MKKIEERLTQCFANVFPDIKPSDIPKASADSLSAWDSVAHITLLSAVSEEFGMDFEVEDYEELTSYAAIAKYLASRPPVSVSSVPLL